MKFLRNPLVGATALYLGTAIGAGIFGLPYVVARTGMVSGIVVLCGVAALTHFTMRVYGEIVARTPGTHQMAGYAMIYLGPRGRILALATQLCGISAALIAYLVGISTFLVTLFPGSGGQTEGRRLFFGVGFWLLAGYVVGRGLRTVARWELVIMTILVIVLIALALFGIPAWHLALVRGGNVANAWEAFGVALFAFGAASIIPEIRRFLLHRRQLAKLHLPLRWGIIISTLVYVTFTIFVIGITGAGTTENAMIGLGHVLGPRILVLGALFGIVTMGSSFIASSFALQEMYRFDFRFSPFAAWIGALLPPLLFFLIDIATFIQILFFTGIVIGGLQGVLILRMLPHARRRQHGKHSPPFPAYLPPWLSRLLQLFYMSGIGIEVVLFFLA